MKYNPKNNKKIRMNIMNQDEQIERRKSVYTEEDLHTALYLISGGISIRKAAKSCGVPYSTLRRRLIKSDMVVNGLHPTYNTKISVVTQEEQVVPINPVKHDYDQISRESYNPNSSLNNDEADEEVVEENSKDNTFSSDMSEAETAGSKRATSSYPVTHVLKKRKTPKDSEQDVNALWSSSKDKHLPASFDCAINNDMPAQHLQPVNCTNNIPMDNTSAAVLETLEMCRELLDQRREQSNTDNRSKIFCNYLCTEIKQIKSDKIFQKLKLDILQLVNNALEENRSDNGTVYVQEIKLEPEIIADHQHELV